MKILIIKRAALGDVLRTTALLGPLRRKFPGVRFSWLASQSSAPLLAGLEGVEAVYTAGGEAAGSQFDKVLSMEEDEAAAGLEGTLAHGSWTGVVVRGGRLSYTPDSAPFYDLSLLNAGPDGGREACDALKKANRKTYEALWAEVLGLEAPLGGFRPALALSEADRAEAAETLDAKVPRASGPLIGLSPGAGNRWTAKRIPDRTVSGLAAAILSRWGVRALLLGGPEEARRNRRLAAEARGDLIDMGTHFRLKAFAALVARLDAVITADSFTLHAANAVGTPAAAAVGPTSPHEISTPGGATLAPPGPCRCWYAAKCSQNTPCLETIPMTQFMEAVGLAVRAAQNRGTPP